MGAWRGSPRPPGDSRPLWSPAPQHPLPRLLDRGCARDPGRLREGVAGGGMGGALLLTKPAGWARPTTAGRAGPPQTWSRLCRSLRPARCPPPQVRVSLESGRSPTALLVPRQSLTGAPHQAPLLTRLPPPGPAPHPRFSSRPRPAPAFPLQAPPLTCVFSTRPRPSPALPHQALQQPLQSRAVP